MSISENIAATLEAAEKIGNPIMTIEFFPDGGVALTTDKGLEKAYEKGDPIFVDDRSPNIEGNNNAQILDNAKKLEQILNIDDDKTGIGFDSPDSRKLNQILNKTTDSQKIEIEADAAVESTITDTTDIIHLKHVETGKVAGGVETEFTPAALDGFINNFGAFSQEPPIQQNAVLEDSIQAQDLQMLDPQNIQTIDSNIQSTEVTEFVTPDAVITLTGNPPVMQVKVDKNADLEKVQEQLDALAKTNSFGPNSEILVKEAMQKLSSHPEFAQQENQVLVVEDINNPVPQINKPAEYNGVASQQPQMSAAI